MIKMNCIKKFFIEEEVIRLRDRIELQEEQLYNLRARLAKREEQLLQ